MRKKNKAFRYVVPSNNSDIDSRFRWAKSVFISGSIYHRPEIKISKAGTAITITLTATLKVNTDRVNADLLLRTVSTVKPGPEPSVSGHARWPQSSQGRQVWMDGWKPALDGTLRPRVICPARELYQITKERRTTNKHSEWPVECTCRKEWTVITRSRCRSSRCRWTFDSRVTKFLIGWVFQVGKGALNESNIISHQTS